MTRWTKMNKEELSRYTVYSHVWCIYSSRNYPQLHTIRGLDTLLACQCACVYPVGSTDGQSLPGADV